MSLRLLAILLLGVVASAHAEVQLSFGVAAKGATETVVRWRYAAINRSGSVMEDASFQVALPLADHGAFTLTSVRVSHAATVTQARDLRVALGRLEPGATMCRTTQQARDTEKEQGHREEPVHSAILPDVRSGVQPPSVNATQRLTGVTSFGRMRELGLTAR